MTEETGPVVHKPKLVFFQWDHSQSPAFAQEHMRLHVRCLEEWFDVVLVNQDCDFDRVCDNHRPQMVLFEAGVNYPKARRPQIDNVRTHPDILRLGLHNGDGWCEARAGFFADMDRWVVEEFFSISTTLAEHVPEAAGRLFTWPNFVDPTVFHDYGESKVIPVLLTGKVDPLYPWRERVVKLLQASFPTMSLPHPGYGYNNRKPAMSLHGE